MPDLSQEVETAKTDGDAGANGAGEWCRLCCLYMHVLVGG